MTLDQFTALTYDEQLAAVFERGRFLATRWQAEHEAVNLYELPDYFFVELTYDGATNEIIDLLGFDRHDQDRLEDYAVSVKLPAWMGAPGK